ncbi:SDR family NAD(P)-dependent oxidoreductase [Streptomyces sp. SID2888]|uniref:SDR family NAD(P)-dependent oxidoreductase n=1 Tax=Streptomyces sp. SID2888 TaxID=2690256 RepID=UPI00136A70DC|nr:SDR family NAD(P)-dependent oxidoreductase [Streptomyces sp. SID2888]MYV50758.1 SDR family oxidoreductase [Streptomyces sp. SID2888]
MATDFTGKTVVVTGGARGQGAAHTALFAELGATVHSLDLLDDLGTALQKDLTGRGLDVTYRHHDVTSEADWDALVAHLGERHGSLDALVNNAGIVHTAEIPEENLARFQQVLSVNTTGVFLGMNKCWALLAGARGSIVNTASVYGLHSNPGYVAYTASKAAVVGMTRTAAIEGAPLGIRANCVSPGTVQTQQLADEGRSYVREATPMDRGAAPSEISHVVAFLASPAASFVTGVEVPVDGGFSAH